MASGNTALERLQGYVGKVKDTDYALEHTAGSGDYEARINKTLQFLQKQVKQQKDALEKVLFCLIENRQQLLIRVLSYEPQILLSLMNHLPISKFAFDNSVRSQQRTSPLLQPSRSFHCLIPLCQPF